jgi:hypothetical protein
MIDNGNAGLDDEGAVFANADDERVCHEFLHVCWRPATSGNRMKRSDCRGSCLLYGRGHGLPPASPWANVCANESAARSRSCVALKGLMTAWFISLGFEVTTVVGHVSNVPRVVPPGTLAPKK